MDEPFDPFPNMPGFAIKSKIVRQTGDWVLGRRGRGLFREQFFSLCSKHGTPQDDCKLCRTGSWSNVLKHKLGHLFFKWSPRLWRWWVNR
jgi:hypothetical protein